MTSEMTDKALIQIFCEVMGRARAIHAFLLLMLVQSFVIAAEANAQECKFCSTAMFFFKVKFISFFW